MPQRTQPAVGALQHRDARVAQHTAPRPATPRSPGSTARRTACRSPRSCRIAICRYPSLYGSPWCGQVDAEDARAHLRGPPRTPRTTPGRSRRRRCRSPRRRAGSPPPCPGPAASSIRASVCVADLRERHTEVAGEVDEHRPLATAVVHARDAAAAAHAPRRARTAPSCRPSRPACASRARRRRRTAPRRRRARRRARRSAPSPSRATPSVRPTFSASTATPCSAARASCARNAVGIAHGLEQQRQHPGRSRAPARTPCSRPSS